MIWTTERARDVHIPTGSWNTESTSSHDGVLLDCDYTAEDGGLPGQHSSLCVALLMDFASFRFFCVSSVNRS